MSMQFGKFALARRREKLAKLQMLHDEELQMRRGAASAAELAERNRQATQRAALQHFLGQTEEFGVDATVSRQIKTEQERRSKTAEAQAGKMRPLEVAGKQTANKQQQLTLKKMRDLQDIATLQDALAAGQDPSTVRLSSVGAAPTARPTKGIKPRAAVAGQNIKAAVDREEDTARRNRLLGRAKRMNAADVRKQIDEISVIIHRTGTKSSIRGRKLAKGLGRLTAGPGQTAAGALKGETALEYLPPKKDKTPRTGQGRPRSKGLPYPKSMWTIYRIGSPQSKKQLNQTTAALSQDAGQGTTNTIKLGWSAQKAAAAVAKMPEGEKKAKKTAALATKYANVPGVTEGSTAEDIYYAGKKLRVGTIKAEIKKRYPSAYTSLYGSRADRDTSKAHERRTTQEQEGSFDAQRAALLGEARGVGLTKAIGGRSFGRQAVANATARLNQKARANADEEFGISDAANAKLPALRKSGKVKGSDKRLLNRIKANLRAESVGWQALYRNEFERLNGIYSTARDIYYNNKLKILKLESRK